MLQPEQLAGRVHHSLVEGLAEIQRDLLLCKQLREEFGDRALPPSSIFRSHRDALRDAPNSMAAFENSLRERMADHVETIQMLENIFADKDAADMEALGAYLRERMKGGK